MKIRLFGLVWLVASFAALRALSRLVSASPVHEATAAELGLALLAVLCGIAGMALTVAGRTLFASVPTPLRSRHPATGEVAEW